MTVFTSRIHAENCYLGHDLAQLQNLFLFQQGSIHAQFWIFQLDKRLPISYTLFHLHCLDISYFCNYSALLSFKTEMASGALDWISKTEIGYLNQISLIISKYGLSLFCCYLNPETPKQAWDFLGGVPQIFKALLLCTLRNKQRWHCEQVKVKRISHLGSFKIHGTAYSSVPIAEVYWTNHTSVQLTHLAAGALNALSNLTGRSIPLPYRGAVDCASNNLFNLSLILFYLFFLSSFLSLIPTSGCISLLCATEEPCGFPNTARILQSRLKGWTPHYTRTEVRGYKDSMPLSFLSDSVFSIAHIPAGLSSVTETLTFSLQRLFHLFWHT